MEIPEGARLNLGNIASGPSSRLSSWFGNLATCAFLLSRQLLVDRDKWLRSPMFFSKEDLACPGAGASFGYAFVGPTDVCPAQQVNPLSLGQVDDEGSINSCDSPSPNQALNMVVVTGSQAVSSGDLSQRDRASVIPCEIAVGKDGDDGLGDRFLGLSSSRASQPRRNRVPAGKKPLFSSQAGSSNGSEGRSFSTFPLLATKLRLLRRCVDREKGSGSFRRKVALVVSGASSLWSSHSDRHHPQVLQLGKEILFSPVQQMASKD